VIIEASDGCSLYAEAHGEGVPLLLSCALCTTHQNWRPQVAPLVAAGARVVLWDYRGHGKSAAPEDPAAYTLERVMADLLHVLDATTRGESAILGGLSFGGLLSLHTALATPERVRGLLLVDTGPGFKKPEAQARWEAQVERTASYVEARGARAFTESKAAPTLVGTKPDLPAARAAAESIAAQTSHGLANFARGVAGPASPVIDSLPDIQCPALVVVGENDAPYLRAAEVLAARLPKARSTTLAGASHIVNIEAEAAFNEAARGFVRSLGG
jgi:pimeloyl-ACP methyl ester carboxylesterase